MADENVGKGCVLPRWAIVDDGSSAARGISAVIEG